MQRGLRRRSVTASLPRLWFRIIMGAWKFVCLLWVLCVVRQRSLRLADHSSRVALPTVARRCVWSRNLMHEKAQTHWGLSRQNKQTKFINIIFNNSRHASKKTHIFIIKINWSVLFTERISYCSANNTKPVSTFCVYNAKFLTWYKHLPLFYRELMWRSQLSFHARFCEQTLISRQSAFLSNEFSFDVIT